MPLSQLKTAANSGPVIISQTIIQPAKRAQQQQQLQQQGATSSAAAAASQQHQQQLQQQQMVVNTSQPQTTQYILAAPQPQQQQQPALPTLTSFTQTRPQTTTLYQTAAGGSGQTPTKILLKTTGTSGVVMTPLRQHQQATTLVSTNPPPLVATTAAVAAGQQTLNIQNVQLPNRPVTIQPASQAAQQQHLQAQLQQQQPLSHPQHTIVSNTTATQQPKLSQVLMQPGGAIAGGTLNVSPTAAKNKTIILTQKGVILRNIGGDMYQIPISNVGGLSGLSAGATLMTSTAAGPPSLVKTTTSTSIQPHTIQLQQQSQQQSVQPGKQLMPTLIPTNPIGGQHVIVQQQTPTSVIGNVSSTVDRHVDCYSTVLTEVFVREGRKIKELICWHIFCKLFQLAFHLGTIPVRLSICFDVS